MSNSIQQCKFCGNDLEGTGADYHDACLVRAGQMAKLSNEKAADPACEHEFSPPMSESEGTCVKCGSEVAGPVERDDEIKALQRAVAFRASGWAKAEERIAELEAENVQLRQRVERAEAKLHTVCH